MSPCRQYPRRRRNAGSVCSVYNGSHEENHPGGQPGSGRHFLLHRLVENRAARFATETRQWHQYDGRDRLISETVANAGTPQVVFTTGYGTRLDGLRTSFSVAFSGQADFQNIYSYDYLLRLTDAVQHAQSGGRAVAARPVAFT